MSPDDPNDNGRVEARGPGWGFTIRGREGRETLLVLILACALAALLVVNHRGFAELTTRQTETTQAIQQGDADHQDLLCLLALPESERRETLREARRRALEVCALVLGASRPLRSDPKGDRL